MTKDGQIMTLQDLMESKPRPAKISIRDAAAIMGVTPRFLQMGLQQERFPFGTGVEMEQWAYYINTERFIMYMTGELACCKAHHKTA